MLTPNEVRAILDQHRWQPDEREAVMAEMAARRSEREASGDQQPQADVVRKQRPLATAQPGAVKPMTQPTDDWVRYIKRQLDSRERLMADCVGDLLGGIEKKHKAALDALRSEVALLKRELAETRAEMGVRSAVDDLQARLAKLETPPRLKAAS